MIRNTHCISRQFDRHPFPLILQFLTQDQYDIKNELSDLETPHHNNHIMFFKCSFQLHSALWYPVSQNGIKLMSSPSSAVLKTQKLTIRYPYCIVGLFDHHPFPLILQFLTQDQSNIKNELNDPGTPQNNHIMFFKCFYFSFTPSSGASFLKIQLKLKSSLSSAVLKTYDSIPVLYFRPTGSSFPSPNPQLFSTQDQSGIKNELSDPETHKMTTILCCSNFSISASPFSPFPSGTSILKMRLNCEFSGLENLYYTDIF